MIDVFAMCQRLAAIRKARGLSMKAVAIDAGVTPGAIHQFEHGTSSPTLLTLERWAAALGATLVLEVMTDEHTRMVTVASDDAHRAARGLEALSPDDLALLADIVEQWPQIVRMRPVLEGLVKAGQAAVPPKAVTSETG